MLILLAEERAKAEKGKHCWIHILLGGGEESLDAQENPRPVLGLHARPVPSGRVIVGSCDLCFHKPPLLWIKEIL